jgi:hypothetical protein
MLKGAAVTLPAASTMLRWKRASRIASRPTTSWGFHLYIHTYIHDEK